MIKALPLVKEVCRSLGWAEPTSINGTSDLRMLKVLQAINYTGLMLGKFNRWRFLKKRYVIRTVPEYTTGTVAITQGSKTVTFTGSVLTESMIGRVFKAVPYAELYMIEAVDIGAGTVTLDQEYNGDTITGKTFKIAQDLYELPGDYDAELNIVEMKTPKTLRLVSTDEMDERKYSGANQLLTGVPDVATVRGMANDRFVLELDPAPKDYQQIILNYYGMIMEFETDDSSWSFLPYFRPLLHDGALHYLRMNAQDDVRAASSMQDFFTGRNELSQTEPFDVRPQMSPETSIYRRARRWRRARSSDIDWGTAFDRGWSRR